MKKYVSYIIITILLVVIASGTTYMLMKDKEKAEEVYYDNTKEDNKQNNKEEDNNKTNNDKEKEEKITLSKSELEKYIDYVPIYNLKSVNVYTINKDLLLHNALGDKTLRDYDFDKNKEIMITDVIYGGVYSAKHYYSKDLVNSILKKRYNYELTNLKNAQSEEDAFDVTYKDGGVMCFYYDNGNFILCGGGGDGTYGFSSVIDSYEANKNELIIYEYHAIYDGWDEIMLKDEYNNYEQDITYIEFKEYNDYKNKIREVIKNNKNKFTKYKHTFKKNNTGYYWYSTEVV